MRRVVVLLCVTLAACAAPSPPDIPLTGNWGGATSQNSGVFFTISADERVTSLTISYIFSTGCGGSRTFSNLSLPIGPLPRTSLSSDVGFSFESLSDGTYPSMELHAEMHPTGANGTLNFRNHPTPSCGEALGVTWTATRR